MRLIVIIIFSLLSSSCEKKVVNANGDLDLKYILIKDGYLDTISRRIQHWTKTDSLTSISYVQRWPGDTSTSQISFELPMKQTFNTRSDFQLVDTNAFEFEGRDYLILKYRYDEEHSDDEEMLVFYSHDFGILINRSAVWGNYDRLLTSNDKREDRTVFYLVEMIANNDKEFFMSW